METARRISTADLRTADTDRPSKPTTLLDFKREPFRSAPTPKGQQPIPSDWNRVDPLLQKAIAGAAELCQWPWYLYGPAGRGKTCAAACVYRQWPESFVCWWDVGFITRELVTARFEGWAGKILRTITDAGLIALDDIALREPTAAQLDALLGILNARGKRPLIITGNLAPQSLAEVLKDDRAASRVCSGTIIHVKGADRRLENAAIFEA